MGSIVTSAFVSLDGVIEDPAGGEGFRLGGWVGQIKDREEVDKVKLKEALDTGPCCWVGAPTSSLPPGGQLGAATWRTG
jgi:hypothetical protein